MSQQGTSIEGLRIYQASRALEDSVYELAKKLPPEEFYKLANDMRRSSAAIAHYISESHKRYSYSAKLEHLHLARLEIDRLKQHLNDHQERGFGDTKRLRDACTGIHKQAWGLVRYFKQRRDASRSATRINATDALVAARSR
jgi:four helix bundle protein